MAFFKNNKFVLTAEKIKAALGFTPASESQIHSLLTRIDSHIHHLERAFLITEKAITTNSIPAHGYQPGASYEIDEQNSYTAIGIIGVKSTSHRIRPTSYYVQNNNYIYTGFANSSPTNDVSAKVTFYILWVKNNLTMF